MVSYCQVWKRKSFGAPHISYSRETIGFSDVSRISNSPRPPKFSVAVFLSAARKIQNASISSPLLQSNLFSIIIIFSDVRAQSALLVHDGSASKSYFCVFRTRRLLQALLLLLVSPPMVLLLLLLGYNTLTAGIDTDFASVLSATVITFHQAVTSSIREARLLGTWSFAMTCLGVLPNWLMFWCLAWY